MKKVILFLGLFLLVDQMGVGQALDLDKERKILINQLKVDIEKAVNDTELTIKALKDISTLNLDTVTKNYIKNTLINNVQDYYAKNATVKVNRIDKKERLLTKTIQLERYLKEPIKLLNIKEVDFILFLRREKLEELDDNDYYYKYRMIRTLTIVKDKENYIDITKKLNGHTPIYIVKDKENYIDITLKNGKAIFNQNQKDYIMFSEKDGFKFKIVGITCIEE